MEVFDDTYVNSTRRNRIFLSDLTKGAGPLSDEFLDETYVNSARLIFFFRFAKTRKSPG